MKRRMPERSEHVGKTLEAPGAFSRALSSAHECVRKLAEDGKDSSWDGVRGTAAGPCSGWEQRLFLPSSL